MNIASSASSSSSKSLQAHSSGEWSDKGEHPSMDPEEPTVSAESSLRGADGPPQEENTAAAPSAEIETPSSDGWRCPRRRTVNLFIFVSHILSKVSDRMWQFAVPVLFVTLFRDTLIPAALFVLVSKLATILFASTIGGWIDRNGRLYVVTLSLFLQNLFVVICALTIFMFHRADFFEYEGGWLIMYQTMVFAMILFTGAVSEIFSVASSVSITKDWVCIVTNNESRHLGFLNKNMRRIDLLCALLSPLLFGIIYDIIDVQYSLVVVVVWNVVSFVPEVSLLILVYKIVPELRHKVSDGRTRTTFFLLNVVRGFSTYFRSDVAILSFSYSLLYLTLADFGVLMTAFILRRWDGNFASILGLARGLGAVSGIAGTWILPFLANRSWIGITKGSAIAIWLQACVLSLAPLSFTFPLIYEYFFTDFMKSKVPSWWVDRLLDIVLISSVIVSRIGLFAFDLGEVQLMQKLVPTEKRGIINSVQQGMCNIMVLIAFSFGVVISNPDYFGVLIMISWISVVLAAVCYTIWASTVARRRRVADLLVYVKRDKPKWWWRLLKRKKEEQLATEEMMAGLGEREEDVVWSSSDNSSDEQRVLSLGSSTNITGIGEPLTSAESDSHDF